MSCHSMAKVGRSCMPGITTMMMKMIRFGDMSTMLKICKFSNIFEIFFFGSEGGWKHVKQRIFIRILYWWAGCLLVWSQHELWLPLALCVVFFFYFLFAKLPSVNNSFRNSIIDCLHSANNSSKMKKEKIHIFSSLLQKKKKKRRNL